MKKKLNLNQLDRLLYYFKFVNYIKLLGEHFK